MAEKALKEIPSDTCLVCGKKYCADDIIVLNGSLMFSIHLNCSEDERKVLREKMLNRRRTEKKSVGIEPEFPHEQKKRSTSTGSEMKEKQAKVVDSSKCQ